MKKTFFIILISIFTMGMTSTSLQAQDNTASTKELSIGFTFGPHALTTFEGEQPFTIGTPLYLGPTFIKDNLGISPFYNFGGNSLGMFLTYQVTNDFGTYLVWDQSLNSKNGIYGLGLTTPLYKNYVVGFVEVGGFYGDAKGPEFLTGLYLTFGKTVKKW